MFRFDTGQRLAALRALLAVAAALIASLAIGCRPDLPQRPSIVFILVDDLGASDLPSYGHPYHHTPAIDALANGGLRFTRAYASSPVCAPTRAALFTGKSPARLHLTHALPPRRDRVEARPAIDRGPAELKVTEPRSATWLDASEVTLAERLRELGYRTALIGKWHLGRGESGPLEQGFDVAVGGEEEAASASYFAPWGLSRIEGAAGEDLTDRLTVEALRFMDESKRDDIPFFLVLSHFAVHTPIEARAEAVEAWRTRLAEANVAVDEHSLRPAYAAMMESLDGSVARVLAKLDELGIERETLVVLTSDNGAVTETPDTGQEVSTNAPLRAGKATLYEGGLRVPAIVRWPAVVRPERTSDALVITTDWFATLLEAAGVHDPAATSSFIPLLRGKETRGDRPMHFFYPHYIRGYRPDPGRETWWNTPAAAIRDEGLKLIHRFDGSDELYDLAADPGESRDLTAERPDDVARLRRMLDAWLVEEDAFLPHTNVAYDPDAFVRGVADSLSRLGASAEWTPNGGCSRVEKGGTLAIDCTTHPFVIGPEMIAEGPVRVAVRCRTTGTTGGGTIWYRAPEKPVFDGDRTAMPACATSWSVAEAVVEHAGTLRQLRIDFGRRAGGRVEIDWIRFYDARNDGSTPSAQWSFDESPASVR